MKIIIRYVSRVLQYVDTLLCTCGIKRRKVIVALDGGICSQIFNYCKGIRYVESGLDVYFDTRWFRTNGKDADGRYVRKFELQEMFPNLPVKIKSDWLCKNWYSRFFKLSKQKGLVRESDIDRTTYLGSQYEQDLEMFDVVLQKYFNVETMCTVDTPWQVESSVVQCGVHVRRGDLALGNLVGYGNVTEGYFIRAVEYVQAKYPNVVFHFFSDEMEWVEQNILPYVDVNYSIEIGHKAWEDLSYLSQCDIIVASQGSFGKMAARLRPHKEVILCKSDLAGDIIGANANVTLIA